MVPEIRPTVLLDGVVIVVDAERTLVLSAEEMKLAQTQVVGGDLIVLNIVISGAQPSGKGGTAR